MRKIEPLVMDVLAFLAARSGETVLRDELLSKIWATHDASDESLTRAVSILRKTLKMLDPDTAYIQTIPKRGYCMVQPVKWPEQSAASVLASSSAKESVDRRANELVLQGRSLNERPFHTDVLTTAASLLEEAISLDPSSANAHSELGHTYSLMSTYIRDGDKSALIYEATQCAERALAIDPTMGFPLTLIALEQFTFGNIVDAISMTEKALQREPRNPEIALRLGYFFAAIGHTSRAIPYIEKAVSLDPIQGRNFQILATVKLSNGDLEEADILAKRAIDMQHYFGCETYAAIAFAMGDYELAGQRLLQGKTYLASFLGDQFVDPAVWKKIVSDAYSPDQATRETLGEWIKNLLFVPGTPPTIPLAQAVVRTGPASAFYEIMGDKPPPGTHGTLLCIWGQTQNCLEIRTHSQFMPFAKSMGMISAWEKYGLPDCLAEHS
ncbi:winged helix-turn-helix domain-containing protein [Yoonia sp.]|uniref:winged helix-turn-helix domain-containing protein n=1 Tax=Yoonia sp. TaxID=2212373 RepID=UPI0023A3FD12|nr:winged helix-turn-helix domain-containing protein [Yoonia sp.]MDE0851977.1 winged helix-turn-helix domain-containing protein [Yoonia sp.]